MSKEEDKKIEDQEAVSAGCARHRRASCDGDPSSTWEQIATILLCSDLKNVFPTIWLNIYMYNMLVLLTIAHSVPPSNALAPFLDQGTVRILLVISDIKVTAQPLPCPLRLQELRPW